MCFVANISKTNVKTTQSSLYGTAHPEKAVDGNYNPYYDDGSCTHTSRSTSEREWWQMTFSYDVLIHSVTIYNRQRVQTHSRLSDAVINVIQQNQENIYCGTTGEMENIFHKTIVCASVLKGKGIKIIAKLNMHLSICEIDVHGNILMN